MKLTKNFTIEEFNFRGYILNPQLLENMTLLAENLQAIREALNCPIIITSWYRPQEINKTIGGSKNSQHLYGEAVDFVVKGLDAKELDDLFYDLVDGAIRLPNPCSQIIRETKGSSNWIHLGLSTDRWKHRQQVILDGNYASPKKTVAKRRLDNCEFLLTRDTKLFETVAYKPYKEFT